jgi:hypothetical protein
MQTALEFLEWYESVINISESEHMELSIFSEGENFSKNVLKVFGLKR